MQVNAPKRKGKSLLGPFFWHFVVLGLVIASNWLILWFRA
jgi:hypothetical protein